ncbi:MAG: 16S rRNA (cytidine(1402)-2'-O)-methyltransferase [Parasporobacterium sp.]|nr:16S rRNA (cytidine(1402)-2'-O)-methyltransferase [Parasporobacterium sp.]MBR3642471.1 16S rRNA (cytidine(1402)-2'-O)-methyltransferase [Parasporobacterium sp.]
MPGKLFLCATPIGNLEDITLRVLETLKMVDLIAAEDTRHTLKLLNHYEINAKLTSYHEHNKQEKTPVLVSELLSGKNIALVTDAGTPAISDPGKELARAALDAGIEVTSLPGASALVVALSMSPLSSRRFVFEGFLPSVKKERREVLESLREETRTIVLYEAPHRIKKTLKELEEVLGDRKINLCRELTKVHEELISSTVSELIRYFEINEPRGEMVLLLEGEDKEKLKEESIRSWEDMSAAEHVKFYTDQGFDEKEAMKIAAKDRGVSKRDIYEEVKK